MTASEPRGQRGEGGVCWVVGELSVAGSGGGGWLAGWVDGAALGWPMGKLPLGLLAVGQEGALSTARRRRRLAAKPTRLR